MLKNMIELGCCPVWFPLPSPTGQSTLSALLCQQMQPHHTIYSPFFSEVPASFAELGNFYKRANIMHHPALKREDRLGHIWVISMGNVQKCIILTFPDPPCQPGQIFLVQNGLYRCPTYSTTCFMSNSHLWGVF